jgi:hypothetical protein
MRVSASLSPLDPKHGDVFQTLHQEVKMRNSRPRSRRPFRENDRASLANELAIPNGTVVTRVVRAYGGAFSLHLHNPSSSGVEDSPVNSGWILTCWGADAIIDEGLPSNLAEETDRAETLDKVDSLLGVGVSAVTIHPLSLALQLSFTTGIRVSFVPDATFPGDDWMVTLPSSQTVSVRVSASIEWDR